MSHNVRRLLLALMGATTLVSSGAAQEESTRFGGANSFDSYQQRSFEELKRSAAQTGSAPTATLGGIQATPREAPATPGGSSSPWRPTRSYDQRNNVALAEDAHGAGATTSQPSVAELQLGPPPSGGPLFGGTPAGPVGHETHPTSILKDPPARTPLVPPSNATPLANGAGGRLGKPSDTPVDHALKGQAGPTAGSGKEGQENRKGQDSSSKPSGRSGWPVMLLLASIAANVYFCWTAWDAHAKYQELVANLSDSDRRLQREKRRMRRADRDEEMGDVDYLQAADA